MNADGDLFQALLEAHRARVAAAVCTIVRTEGSTPLKAGAKMLVRGDGATAGTIGGGALEHAVIAQAQSALVAGAPVLETHRLVRDHNMCCGGTVEVFIDVLPVAVRLNLFGAGHVNRAIAEQASLLGWEIAVVDARPGIFEGWPAPAATLIGRPPREALEELAWDARSCTMIATHSHPLDREVLALALRRPCAYLGMIGSRRKVRVTRTLFLEHAWATAEELDAVDMPAGAAIGAATPQEIAVSVLASMIRTLHRGRAAAPAPVPAEATDVAPCLHDTGSRPPSS